MAIASVGALGVISHILSEGVDSKTPSCPGRMFDMERSSPAKSSYENGESSLITELTSTKDNGPAISELKPFDEISKPVDNIRSHGGTVFDFVDF